MTMLEERLMTPTICTFSGKRFNPFDPQPEDIDIKDISHALANVCRYAGHCKKYFSVAQHSVLVSKNVSAESAAWGLLHDASEAYIGDIPAPLKVTEFFDFYREMEDKIMECVAEKFGLSPSPLPEVKEYDLIVRETEMRDFGSVPEELRGNYPTLKNKIIPLNPFEAMVDFQVRYSDLKQKGMVL